MEGKYDQDSRKTIRSGGKRDYDSDFILNWLVVRLWHITAIWMSINLFCESKISSLSAAQFLCLCSKSQQTWGWRGCRQRDSVRLGRVAASGTALACEELF